MPQQLCPRLGPSDALLGARLPEKGSALSLCHVPERCGGMATVLLWKKSHLQVIQEAGGGHGRAGAAPHLGLVAVIAELGG